MLTLTLHLLGEVPPSKKNAKQIIWRGRRPLLMPSSRYTKWHKSALPEIKDAFERSIVKPEGDQKFTIVITFYPKTKRLWDLSNKAESVMDLLVDAKIIKDDNWSVVPVVNLIFGGVQPTDPRTTIQLFWDMT